jgi:hypothetical protein
MSAANAGAAVTASAAIAASVNFFIGQPLPIVSGLGGRLTLTDGLDFNEDTTATSNQ